MSVDFIEKMNIKFYNYWLRQKTNVKKRVAITVACLLFCVFFILKYIRNKENMFSLIIGVILGLIFAIYYFMYILIITKLNDAYMHFYELEEQESLTKDVIINKIPRNVKISGRRGAGKDTLMSGMGNVVVEYLRNLINQRNEFIENILFFHDFKFLESKIKETNIFMVPSISKKKQLFKHFCFENKCFLKEYYLKNDLIDYNEYYSYWKIANDDVNNIPKKYKYDNGLNQIFLLEMLYEYSENYYRITFGDVFSMSNQPFKEIESGKMAKIFSNSFFKLEMKDTKIENRMYKPIKTWPWNDYVAIMETEVDILQNNVSSDVDKEVKTCKMDDLYRVSRHILGENCFHYKVGQKNNRVKIQFRELEEAFITVLDSEKINGGRYRNFFHQKELIKSKNKVSKIDNKKRKIMVKKLELLLNQKRIEASIKYAYIISKLKGYRELMIKKYALHYMQIEKNENEGYIKEQVLVCNNMEDAGTLLELSLDELLSIEKNQYKQKYTCVLTFKLKNCRGNYNTHYMKSLAIKKSDEADQGFYDVPTWKPNLLLTDDDIAYMDYAVYDNLFKISSETLNKVRYKPNIK